MTMELLHFTRARESDLHALADLAVSIAAEMISIRAERRKES